MRKNQNKKRQRSASRVIQLFGTAAAVVPLAMSMPAAAGAQSLQAPQLKASIDSLLANAYSSSLIAGNSFTIDLGDVFQNAGVYGYAAFVQYNSVADVSVVDSGAGKSLRIVLKKAGTTKVDLMAWAPETENYVHERFTLTVSPNYALNSSGNADIGDVIRYYKSHAGEFKTADDYRRLLQTAVSSSAPPVNHPPVVFLRNTTGSVSTDVQEVHLTLGEQDTESFDLSDYFSDEDGDALSYRIVAGNDYDHPVSGSTAYGRIVEGSHLELHASSIGEMDVVVEASDQKFAGTATMTFHLVAEQGQVTDPEPGQGHRPQETGEIGDRNTFSMRSGQTATIDLARMFTDIDGDPLQYNVTVDGDFVEAASSGSLVTLQTTGSSSTTYVTVGASDDGGANWTSQLITINPGDGSDLRDVNYPNTESSKVIDLAASFEGNYTYAASVSEGTATASVSGSELTLGFQPDSVSTVEVAAADGSGLTIHDRFQVSVGEFILHTVGVNNEFSLRYGQSASIDLSQMFVATGEGDVSYSFSLDDGDYVNLEDPYLLLDTPGSSSTSQITVRASDDNGAHWTSQSITVSASTGSDLPDVNYPGTETPEPIDLAEYFDGSYDYGASVSIGQTTAAVNGSQLTLGLQPGSTLVKVAAADGNGLTINDQFQVAVAVGQGGNTSPFSIHPIGIGNTFNIASGQSATIDLSQMFGVSAADDVMYEISEDDDSYLEEYTSGSLVYLQATGSPSVTQITVKASDDDGANWTEPQLITISPSEVSKLPDKTYEYSDKTATIDLAEYFDNYYTYEASVSEGPATTEIDDSILTLGLQSGSSSFVKIAAADGNGLSIYDRFQAVVGGMAVHDIGTQLMYADGDDYYASVDLRTIFPNATNFHVTAYDGRIQGLSNEWFSDPYLSINALATSNDDYLDIDVEAENVTGERGRYTIRLNQNSAPYAGFDRDDIPSIFVKKGGMTPLYFTDNEEDSIQSLVVSAVNPAMFTTDVPSQNYVVNVNGVESGSGQMTVDVSDGKLNGSASYSYPVYVYDEQAAFDGDDWSTSLNLNEVPNLTADLDTSDPSALHVVSISPNSLLEDVYISDNVLNFSAKADPTLVETPVYGSELVRVTISDGTHLKDTYIFVDHSSSR